ncbi:MAG: glycosyltransferase family 2 protein [Roseibacillus sp.]|nr:glycosyltransferase family 2 protein [Roseibacillus sp.]
MIPCFNEEQSIAQTVEDIGRVLAGRNDFEILVIDDGSTDRSRGILEGFEVRLPALRVIHHHRNAGYGAALTIGCRS